MRTVVPVTSSVTEGPTTRHFLPDASVSLHFLRILHEVEHVFYYGHSAAESLTFQI